MKKIFTKVSVLALCSLVQLAQGQAGAEWIARETNRNWYAVASSADGNKLVAVTYSEGASPGVLYTSTDGGTNWLPRFSRRWVSVASSADGIRLIAADLWNGANPGRIYTSNDGGTNWVARGTNHYWRSVGISGDGLTMLAGETWLHVSTDVGTNWIQRAHPSVL